MTAKPPIAHRLRVAHLNARAGNEFTLLPDAETRAAIATELGLLALPALAFDGEVRAKGADSWGLKGHLTARVVQPCAVTLSPVETAIDEQVERIFSPHVTAPLEEEAEMPDDALEPLGQFIDLGAVMIESLSLALPLYPRAPDADLPEAASDPAPEDEERRKPFAGLADLLKKGD